MDDSATKIQKVVKGFLYRSKRLPLILHIIQKYLRECLFKCSEQYEDGRINSSIDENEIIKILVERFNKGNIIKIKIPNIRMWFDILVYDFVYGWIPVNIKTTKMLSHDNTGNLAMCVYSYTHYKLDLHQEKTYDNGKMAKILIKKLKRKEYNRKYNKDYYFIVLNKTTPQDIIINSIKGLCKLYPNLNNLPFQVCWKHNREYIYDKIENKIGMFINCFKKSKRNWRERFLYNIKNLKRKREKDTSFCVSKRIKL